MKRLLLASAAFFSVSAFAIPIIMDAPVRHIYVPSGFDDNDNVEVVVAGEFPSPCYTRNTVDVKRDGNKINIQITAIYNIPGGNEKCGRMIVPFKEVINLGQLADGEYKIKVNQKSPTELNDKVKIAPAEINAVDERIYANIEYIETTRDPKKIILKGYNPSTCLVFSRFEFYSNHKDTISVMPVMRKVSDFCPMKMTEFEVEANLDFSDMKTDNVLIHTRVMDGRSVNTIIDLK